jgi:hypothetical protein
LLEHARPKQTVGATEQAHELRHNLFWTPMLLETLTKA